LLTSYPYQGNNQVYNVAPNFRLIFDRKLNTTNIQSAIRVLDENGVVLAKNARSVVNNSVSAPYGSTYFSLSSNLVAGKEYTLVVDGDVADEVGMEVVEPIAIKFRAANVLVTTQPVVESFETVSYVFDESQSVDATTATTTTSSTRLFGSFSNKFAAAINTQAGFATFKANSPVIVNNQKVIGLHVYGDLTGNELQLQFTAGAEVKYVKLCDLNFRGWEFHEVELTSLAPLTDYQLTGFRIVRKSNWLFSANVEVYVDNMLLYDEMISSVSDIADVSIKIYPNPAVNFVRVSGLDTENTVLQLYSINGTILKEVHAIEMNIQDIAVGTYILKIQYKNQMITRPLIIAR